MILYKGKTYETRDITICPNDIAMNVTIAKKELEEELYPALRVGETHAQNIDEQIMYYCDEEEWAKTDCEMARFLEDL